MANTIIENKINTLRALDSLSHLNKLLRIKTELLEWINETTHHESRYGGDDKPFTIKYIEKKDLIKRVEELFG